MSFINKKETWLGGPSHHLQSQHIPGYAGHVPNLISEGIYAKPFAKLTADCLQKRVQRGFMINENQRFRTTYGNEYHTPSTFQKTADNVFMDYTKRLKRKQEVELREKPKRLDDVPVIDRVPVVGYMGFKAVFRHPLKQVKKCQASGQKSENDQNWEGLGSGYQKAMVQMSDQIRKEVQPKKIPIVGYDGYIRGYKPENMFGKSYRETTLDSAYQYGN